MIYKKVTGEFLNGHKYQAIVAPEDFADFEENFMNSTDNGSELDLDTIEMIDIEIEV